MYRVHACELYKLITSKPIGIFRTLVGDILKACLVIVFYLFTVNKKWEL